MSQNTNEMNIEEMSEEQVQQMLAMLEKKGLCKKTKQAEPPKPFERQLVEIGSGKSKKSVECFKKVEEHKEFCEQLNRSELLNEIDYLHRQIKVLSKKDKAYLPIRPDHERRPKKSSTNTVRKGDKPKIDESKVGAVPNRCESSMGDYESNHSRCRCVGSGKIVDNNGRERNICKKHLKQIEDHKAKFLNYPVAEGTNRSWYDNPDWLLHYSTYKADRPATNPDYKIKKRTMRAK
tara:strand:+ start:155 stop:859 length:705 start_codon:yes stop_codon:yes gene_type:complete